MRMMLNHILASLISPAPTHVQQITSASCNIVYIHACNEEEIAIPKPGLSQEFPLQVDYMYLATPFLDPYYFDAHAYMRVYN